MARVVAIPKEDDEVVVETPGADRHPPPAQLGLLNGLADTHPRLAYAPDILAGVAHPAVGLQLAIRDLETLSYLALAQAPGQHGRRRARGIAAGAQGG
jgi:hypothetical protein